MSQKEMLLFKDEILNKLRELETRFFNEISKKNSDINLNLNTFNEKVNSIIESNRKMIETVTSQKLNFEKIAQLETSRKYMDEVLTTHDVKLSSMTSEIDKMRFKYDKILGENLIIPGYIGVGCNFRNLREFIVNSIIDIKKLKEEKEILKRQEKEMKSKIELMLRNMTNMVEYNSARIREYTNSKDHEIEDMLNDKLKKHDEKALESNQKLVDTQSILEKKIKEITNEIGKINSSKENINSVINKKFEEINKREEEMNEKLYLALFEVKEVQKMKKELAEEIKNIYTKMDSIDKNKKKESIKNENNLKDKIIAPNLHLNTNYNISNNNTQILKSVGYTKKDDLPNLNTQTKIVQNNNNSFLKNVVVKTENIVSNNFSLNSISSKKFVLKEEDFLKTKQNIKIKNLNEKIIPTKKKEIKEEIFQKTFNNIRIDKIETKNDDEHILSKKSIKHFFNSLEAHFIGPKLKLASLEYSKKISDKLLSMSDDEEFKQSNEKNKNSNKYNDNNFKILNNKDSNIIIKNNKIYNNSKNNKFINKIKNNFINYGKDLNNSNNSNIDTVNKNIQTPSRKIKSVDCNLVNINLLNVPNINDNNKSDDSNINEMFFRTSNGRKIYSVDSKRRRKNNNIQIEKKNNKFFSSKNILK